MNLWCKLGWHDYVQAEKYYTSNLIEECMKAAELDTSWENRRLLGEMDFTYCFVYYCRICGALHDERVAFIKMMNERINKVKTMRKTIELTREVDKQLPESLRVLRD